MTGILKGTIRPQAVLKGEISKTVEIIGSVIKPLTVTKNGTHEVPEGVNGFNPVIVSVPERKEEQTKTVKITKNGTHEVKPDENKVLSSVSLEVDVKDETLAEIETTIDESGVLDSTEGTVEDKVDSLIDKAVSENVWYVASKYINFQNQNSPFGGADKGTEKTIPRINFAENTTTNYLYSFSGGSIEYIDYYMDTEKGVNFSSCFSATHKLKWIQGINISNATTINDMFNSSSIERIIEPLDFTNITSKNKWNYAPNLSDFRIIPESYKLSGDFPYAVYTADTIQSIIDGLAYVETEQILTFHSSIAKKITDEQYDTIFSKNWKIA